ncbi:MAG: hypothetical protein V4487_04695, partial [Chlamydiota bacterium]
KAYYETVDISKFPKEWIEFYRQHSLRSLQKKRIEILSNENFCEEFQKNPELMLRIERLKILFHYPLHTPFFLLELFFQKIIDPNDLLSLLRQPKFEILLDESLREQTISLLENLSALKRFFSKPSLGKKLKSIILRDLKSLIKKNNIDLGFLSLNFLKLYINFVEDLEGWNDLYHEIQNSNITTQLMQDWLNNPSKTAAVEVALNSLPAGFRDHLLFGFYENIRTHSPSKSKPFERIISAIKIYDWLQHKCRSEDLVQQLRILDPDVGKSLLDEKYDHVERIFIDEKKKGGASTLLEEYQCLYAIFLKDDEKTP